LIYGTSLATWQVENDPEYLQLVDHEAALLFTEDDLLWWRLKPTPDAEPDFTFADQFMKIAEQGHKLVLGAHLVWDEGFGEEWTEDDLWGMDEQTARRVLFDTINAEVSRYRGRMAGWIVVNEVIDAHTPDGLRTDYPWLQTIGQSVIAEAFQTTHEGDPEATLLLNEFGFETDSEYDRAADRRSKTLLVLDQLLDADVPVQALGIQAHLVADGFAEKFDVESYQQFLATWPTGDCGFSSPSSTSSTTACPPIPHSVTRRSPISTAATSTRPWPSLPSPRSSRSASRTATPGCRRTTRAEMTHRVVLSPLTKTCGPSRPTTPCRRPWPARHNARHCGSYHPGYESDPTIRRGVGGVCL